MFIRKAFDRCCPRKSRVVIRVVLMTLLPLALQAELSADVSTVKEELAAAHARSRYYLALLSWQANRPREAVHFLRQIPPSQRGLEWHLTHREFYGEDITCYGHTDEVDSVAFSPDGAHVASGGADNRVRLWDARTGLQLKVWQGLDSEPNAAPPHASSVCFSPDGSELAAGCGYGTDIGFDGVIKIWDVKTGGLLRKLDEPRWVTRIEFSRDGRKISYGTLNNTAAMVWDLDADEKLTFKITDEITYIRSALSPDGALVAAGEFGRPVYRGNRVVDSEPCSIKLWDAASGEEFYTLDGHTKAIADVAFSPDGTRLASADYNGKVKLWDVQTGKALQTFAGHGPLQFTPNGTHLVTNTAGDYGNRSLQFLTLETNQLVPLKEPAKPGYWTALRPDGTCIAGTAGNRIKLWDVRTGETIATLKGHVKGHQQMAFSPDGTWLATGGSDHTVRLWDCRGTGNEWSVKAGEEVAFSPDGKSVAIARDTIQLWDTRDGRKIRELKNHTGRVTCVAFSTDSKLLASAGRDKTARVWETATGKELAVLEGHTSAVTSVAFNNPGNQLVTGGAEDKSIRTWTLRGEPLMKAEADVEFRGFPGRPKTGTDYIHGVTWSPNGKWILSLYDSSQSGPWWDRGPTSHIRMWDAATGEQVTVFKGHKWAVTSVAFSSDSRWIVSAGKDATIRVWDAETHEEVRIIDGHVGPVHDVVFSPDSTRILSVGADATVRVWDRKTGDELKTFGQPKETNESGFSHIPMRNRVAITAAGDVVRAKRGNEINRWSARTTEQVHMLQGLKPPVAIRHDGKLVASVSGVSIYLWDVASGRKLRTLPGHTAPIRCLAFDQSGALLASASQAQRVRVWDAATGEQLHEFKTGTKSLSRVAFHPNGMSVLAEGTFDQRVAWDIESGRLTSTKNWPHQAFDPPHRSSDGRWLLTPLGSHVRVADLQFTSGKDVQAYFLAKTSRSHLWHQQQATAAEQNANWYAAAFHRAWELKIDPASQGARQSLEVAKRKLQEGQGTRALVPPIADEVLGAPR